MGDVAILDQDLAPVLTRRLELHTLAQDKTIAAQGSARKLKKPVRNSQFNRWHAALLSLLTTLLYGYALATTRVDRERLDGHSLSS